MRCQDCAHQIVQASHFKAYPHHTVALRNGTLDAEEQAQFERAVQAHFIMDESGRYSRTLATHEYIMYCEHERIPSLVARQRESVIDVYLDLPGIYGWTKQGIEQLFTYLASLTACSFRVTLDNACIVGLSLTSEIQQFMSGLYTLAYGSMSSDKLDKQTMRALYQWQKKYMREEPVIDNMYW